MLHKTYTGNAYLHICITYMDNLSQCHDLAFSLNGDINGTSLTSVGTKFHN